jgi:DHA1 family multidrug resistance protein-like MFS transporter
MIISGSTVMLSGGLIFPVFAPFVRSEFTAPVLLVGLSVSGYFVVRMFSEFPIGALSDRIGPRKPLLLGRLLAIAGAFLCYNATEVWQLIIARALWGVGDAAFFCIGMSYVASLFTANRRGRALGMFQAVEMIGSLVGQSVGGFTASVIGIRTNFLLSTALGVIALVMVSMVRGERHNSASNPGGSIIPSRQLLSTILNRQVLLACMINFFGMMRNNGVTSTLLPIYVTEVLSIPLTQYGLIISASTIGSVSGNIFGGLLSDRVGRKKTLTLGFLIGTATTFSLSIAGSFLQFIPVMFFNGLFWGIVYGTTPALIADSVPDDYRGMGIGAFRTFFDFGGLMGPIAFSGILEYIGYPAGFTGAFYVGAAMMAMNLLFVLRLKDKN